MNKNDLTITTHFCKTRKLQTKLKFSVSKFLVRSIKACWNGISGIDSGTRTIEFILNRTQFTANNCEVSKRIENEVEYNEPT